MRAEVQLGIHYYFTGWQLIMKPGIRRFIFIPILANIILLSILLWFVSLQLNQLTDWIVSYVPSWLSWLQYILSVFFIIMILMFFYFIFTALIGFIIAPFNSILAEKIESMLTGEIAHNESITALIKDIPRMMKREWQKLLYSVIRFAGLFLLGFIPLLGQTVVPILMFLFTAWMLAIQYCDYPFDNHKYSFQTMRRYLATKRTCCITFGSCIALSAFVPLVNFIVIPVAVCGATAMWVDCYRNNALLQLQQQYN